ncbi:MAG: GNAT family N-acetyltransferase [Bacteroidales bacterium]|nr:GNAT family N-acetyltransferase [Bacteroidales bacterium]
MVLEPIIDPVDKSLLLKEFEQAKELTEASRGDIKVYLVDYTSPNILREVGRLREIAFRKGGGGTGKACDIDDFDTDPSFKVKQLVVWDAEDQCICGGYRFVYGYDMKITDDGQPIIPAAHLFHFSEKFMNEEMPHTMELSRSYIVEQQQRTNSARKSIFILDCLFKAICVVARDGKMTDIFGKVTFYRDYPQEAFSMVTSFMKKHCGAGGKEIVPKVPYVAEPAKEARKIFKFKEFRANFRALTSFFIQKKLYLPPILKSYMNLTTTMRYYGAMVNDEFGGVIEMGIKVHLPDLDKDRWELYFKEV